MVGYLIAFGLTIIIECAVALIFARDRKLLLAVVAVNFFTHPLFGALLWIFPSLRGVPSVPIIELAIVIVEAALMMMALPERKKSFLFMLSLSMNLASYLAGVVMNGSWG